MGGKYLNVDLDVRSRVNLLPLREELGDDVDLMFCGESEPGSFLLSVELAGSGLLDSEPDETARALCKLVENLPASARKDWDSAYDRVFDIGFESVPDSNHGLSILSPETLQQIGSLNARLALSIYTNSQATP
jgi:hypothetical protein